MTRGQGAPVLTASVSGAAASSCVATSTRSARPRPILPDERIAIVSYKDTALDPALEEFLRAQERESVLLRAQLADRKAADTPIAIPECRSIDDYQVVQRSVHTQLGLQRRPSSSGVVLAGQDPALQPYIRYQDAHGDAFADDSGLGYDLDEADEVWIEQVNAKGGKGKDKLAEPLTADKFETTITLLERWHWAALQALESEWSPQVKAWRVPKLPSVAVVLPKSVAINKLTAAGESSKSLKHNPAALSLVYDRWLQMRKVAKGPLLQHLWLEQPYKAICFASTEPGEEGECGDMPFVVSETGSAQRAGGHNRLRLTDRQAHDMLVDVRGELEALRTLTDQVRKRERLKKQLVNLWASEVLAQLADMRAAVAVRVAKALARAAPKAAPAPSQPIRSRDDRAQQRVHFQPGPSPSQPVAPEPPAADTSGKSKRGQRELACLKRKLSRHGLAATTDAAAAGACTSAGAAPPCPGSQPQLTFTSAAAHSTTPYPSHKPTSASRSRDDLLRLDSEGRKLAPQPPSMTGKKRRRPLNQVVQLVDKTAMAARRSKVDPSIPVMGQHTVIAIGREKAGAVSKKRRGGVTVLQQSQQQAAVVQQLCSRSGAAASSAAVHVKAMCQRPSNGLPRSFKSAKNDSATAMLPSRHHLKGSSKAHKADVPAPSDSDEDGSTSSRADVTEAEQDEENELPQSYGRRAHVARPRMLARRVRRITTATDDVENAHDCSSSDRSEMSDDPKASHSLPKIFVRAGTGSRGRNRAISPPLPVSDSSEASIAAEPAHVQRKARSSDCVKARSSAASFGLSGRGREVLKPRNGVSVAHVLNHRKHSGARMGRVVKRNGVATAPVIEPGSRELQRLLA